MSDDLKALKQIFLLGPDTAVALPTPPIISNLVKIDIVFLETAVILRMDAFSSTFHIALEQLFDIYTPVLRTSRPT